MKAAWIFLLSCCLLFRYASAIGAVPLIGITGAGKTVTANAATGCKGEIGGTAAAVTTKPVVYDSQTCSGLKQNFQIVDTAGFMHHASDKIILDGAEVSGKTFSLLGIADALQLNPEISAVSLVHACTKRLDEHYLQSLSHVVDLVSAVPIPFHLTFTQCSDAHCLQCKEDYQKNLGAWNKIFGCFGGKCDSSDPNSILGSQRLIGATFVEHEGCAAGNEVSCINVNKLRQDFAKWFDPLTPVTLKVPHDYKQKLLAGDIPTTKRHAKEQYCGTYIQSYESLSRGSGESAARLSELHQRLSTESAAPLPPFPKSFEQSCPAPNPQHCDRIVRECGNRRWGLFGPRSCHEKTYTDHTCRGKQAAAQQHCHALYHQQMHEHFQWAQAQKDERIRNIHQWIAAEDQELARISGSMAQTQHQYNFCKNPTI